MSEVEGETETKAETETESACDQEEEGIISHGAIYTGYFKRDPWYFYAASDMIVISYDAHSAK